LYICIEDIIIIIIIINAVFQLIKIGVALANFGETADIYFACTVSVAVRWHVVKFSRGV
jgi:hypothetical protein